MAEPKKERKIVKASGQSGGASAKSAAPSVGVKPENKGRANAMRLGAVALWLLAVGAEVLCILLLNGTLYIPGNQMTWLIVGVVVDLVLVVIGATLWKKSNRLAPISEKNKALFYLWEQMGLIAAVICFLPLVVLLLKDQKLDKKTKRIVTAVAAVALVAACALSIDYNPVSEEDLVAAQTEAAVLGDGTVYWTPFGKKYHLNPDCQSLSNSSTIYEGTMDEAFAANRTSPCSFCAKEGGEDLMKQEG